MYSIRYEDPKLAGVVIKEAVRCGKPNCKCARGKLHKWYYYLYYRKLVDGEWKLKKEYVPRNKVKYIRKKISRIKNEEKQTKLDLQKNMLFLKIVKYCLKTGETDLLEELR
ncbi:MAG: DUF6788 family protein [Candidatus Aerophobetes bacterium]|nr:DUF6788 family protein [Candidatus Aerophobetes bacterium]